MGESAERLPFNRPAMSKRVRILGAAGLAVVPTGGRRRLYSVDPAALAALLDELDPVWRRALALGEAFDLFMRRISRWWPVRGQSCFDEQARDVRFEPCAGGAVTAVECDGRRMALGEATSRMPPHGFAMRWFPGPPEAQATWSQVHSTGTADACTEVGVRNVGREACGAEAHGKRQSDGEGLGSVQAHDRDGQAEGGMGSVAWAALAALLLALGPADPPPLRGSADARAHAAYGQRDGSPLRRGSHGRARSVGTGRR